MAYSVSRTSGKEQVVFYKDFFDAQPGQHMYRFRVGRKTWMVDDDCEVGMKLVNSLLHGIWLTEGTGKDSQGTQHNIIRVENKPDSVQVPLGTSSMLLASTITSDQPPLLVKVDGQQIIATKADVTPEQQKEQLTAAATDALHMKADDLPPPHSDPAQFSELAVSPPANETLHAQGILGDAIETAILHAGPSAAATEPVNASAGTPILDLNASTAPTSTPVLPTSTSTANSASSEIKKEDVANPSSALPIADLEGPPTSLDTPKLPEAPVTTPVASAERVKQDDTTKKIDIVGTHLEEKPTADGMKDQTIDFDREPAEVVMELGIIDEEPENGEDVMNAIQTPEPVRKHHHHHHSRKQQLGKWVSVGFLLLGGAITGVLVGVFILHMLEGFNLAPVVGSVESFDLAPVVESVERLEDL